ncbi:hypothetical protein [Microbispora sp. NPDC049125]|uniref:hypothetical protein n=1 Tax=Microbispora sp. NPDC049125 TaxID=3154929 RepID=UPI003465081D
MAVYIDVEPLDDHRYLVRIREDAEEAEVRFQAGPAVLDELDITGADEAQIVKETAAYLTRRQSVIDLPPMIDLYDVAAAYGEDYVQELRRRLRPL